MKCVKIQYISYGAAVELRMETSSVTSYKALKRYLIYVHAYIYIYI